MKTEWEDKKQKTNKTLLEGRKNGKKNVRTKKNCAIYSNIPAPLSVQPLLNERSYVYRLNRISKVKNYLFA
jgi:hypothetical protein